MVLLLDLVPMLMTSMGAFRNAIVTIQHGNLEVSFATKGDQLTHSFNKKPHKTPLPARKQVILGCLYDSLSRMMKSSPSKVSKYVGRIDSALSSGVILVKDLMSLHGNLSFAANVAPFGKPFLATLTNLLVGYTGKETVKLDRLAKLSLRI